MNKYVVEIFACLHGVEAETKEKAEQQVREMVSLNELTPSEFDYTAEIKEI